jgi:hypothetical protein
VAPATFLAVRDRIRLVVVDTATGEDQQVLFELPEEPSLPEYERQVFAGISLSADGQTAVFSAGPRREPELRLIYRVPVAGGPAEQIAVGSSPSVSPDGRRLAYITEETVVIQDLATGATRRIPQASADAIPYPLAVEWAADSRQIVLESQWEHSLRLLDADTAAHQSDGRPLGDSPPKSDYWLAGVRASDGLVAALLSYWKPETDVGQASRTMVLLNPATGAEHSRTELPVAAWDADLDASGRHQLLLAEDNSVYRSSGDGFVRIASAGADLIAW